MTHTDDTGDTDDPFGDLEPESAAIVAAARAAGPPPPPDAVPIADIRAAMDAMAVTGHPPVHRVEEVRIPGPGGDLPGRLYAPATDTAPPLLVFLHGGGWVMGSIAHTDGFCRRLVNGAGVAVLSVDYRLAPEHPFPAGLEDGYSAVQWAHAEAATLGIDPGRIAVGGESAGGNLAAATALLARDRSGPPLVFQLLVYPVTDREEESESMRRYGDGFLLTRDAMRWFWDLYVGAVDEPPHLAAVARSPDLTGLPPALVVTAGCDPLRDQAEAYAARLRASGVAADVFRSPGTIHGFTLFADLLQAGRDGVDRCIDALRRGLHGH